MEMSSDPEKPRPIYPPLGILAVFLGASLATLFGRLLSVGVPDIRGALHLDADSASWITSTYNMGTMFVGPFSVYLGGLLGPRRVLLAGACIFTITCAVMPFAGHFSILICLLALAGLTAGTFYPLTLSFVLRNLPQKYLPFGIAAYAIDVVVSTHVAHSFEGWIMSALSWRWSFWAIALLTPVMIAMVVFGIQSQPLPKPKPGQASPSWRGFFYASLGAALLYGALDQAQRLDWWRSGTFVAMFVVGLLLIAAAVTRHFSRPNPLINYPFLRRWNTALLCITVMLFRFVLLASVVLIPSYLSAIKNYRPEQTGPVLLWLAIPQFVAGVLAIYLLNHIDARLILACGFALIAVGCILDSQITTLWSGNSFDASQLILAMGEGFAFCGMVGSIVLNILNSGSMQDAAAVLSFGGLFQTVRLFGGELGASFIQFFLHARQVFQYDLLASGIQGGSEPLLKRAHMLSAAMHPTSQVSSVASARASDLLLSTVKQQAFTLSTMDSFTLIAYAATACLLVVCCLRPMKIGFAQITAARKSDS